MDEKDSRFRPFPTTRWSLILKVAGGDEEDREDALAEICGLYWPPIYAYIRNQGRAPHDAEDLTQEFFARFLDQDHFARPESERGRLRSYLLSSVRHFLANEHRKETRQKRGGSVQHLSIDAAEGETRYHFLIDSENLSPDQIFDRQWAACLLESVLRKLDRQYRESGQAELFTRLNPYIRSDIAPPAQSEVAVELGMSNGALRVAIHRLRQRYRKLLLEELLATVESEGDLAEEMEHLKAVFG